MKISDFYNFRNGLDLLKKKAHLFEEMEEIIIDPNILFGIQKPSIIKKNIAYKFNRRGWADRVRINKNSNLTISYMKEKVGICFQIGNVARTYADILKLEYMAKNNFIDVCVIAVPGKMESKILGANYADFERLTREIENFHEIIPFPFLIISLTN